MLKLFRKHKNITCTHSCKKGSVTMNYQLSEDSHQLYITIRSLAVTAFNPCQPLWEADLWLSRQAWAIAFSRGDENVNIHGNETGRKEYKCHDDSWDTFGSSGSWSFGQSIIKVWYTSKRNRHPKYRDIKLQSRIWYMNDLSHQEARS
jgi:hypothetical protein